MVIASTSAHMAEQAPQTGHLQGLCPWSMLHLPLPSPGDSLRSASKCDQPPFNLLFLLRVLELVRFCVRPLRMKSLFPTTLHNPSPNKSCWPSKRNVLGFIFLVQDPELGSLMWRSNPSLLRENHCNYNYSSNFGSPTWVYESSL